MHQELFPISIFYGPIDSKKIILNNVKLNPTWLSQTMSSYDPNTKQINEKTEGYLMDIIASLLQEKIKFGFKLGLINIWENHYRKDDYQEPHIHPQSDLSFIIYKKVKKSETVLLNPFRNMIFLAGDPTELHTTSYHVNLKQNNLIIFPSFLEHMVLKNSDQITIAGNLKFSKI